MRIPRTESIELSKDLHVVGMDPGMSFGWSILCRKKKVCEVIYIDSGVWNLSTSRAESRGMTLIRLENHLLALFRRVSKEGQFVVAYEHSRFFKGRQVDASQSHGAITGHVQYLCERQGIQFTGISPMTVKKYAAGSGKADKSEVRRSMVDRFEGGKKGRKKFGKKDDETDAVAVALAFIEMTRV